MTNYLLPFGRQKSNEPWFERLQDYLDKFFSIICKNPFIDGQEISHSLSAGAATEIPHSLGRTPRVWKLLDVYTVDAVNPPSAIERRAWDTDSLTLFSDKAYTVKLWVN